jgi:TolB-like protein/DNA-binding winged helix-turn-helix (wHTH) protein
MNTEKPHSGPIRFGAFEVDLRTGELRKHGIKIKLQEQPLQILQQLLEHPGEVVNREELQKRIWPADTFVDFDHGLYSAVQRLRDALGDTAETPRYVETLPRRGYRFIAPVNNANRGEAKVETANVEAPASAVPERPAPQRSFRIPMLVATGAILVALLFALAFRGGSLRERLLGKPAVPPIRSIAVLPLQNLSNDPNQEYFADGMTEELITDLSQVGALRVASHQSVLRYKKSDKPLPEIARELNVDALVEGSVQRTGDRVRITAQLIYAPQDKNIFAKSYERDFRDALALQRTVAAAIVEEIRGKMAKEEVPSFKPVQPGNSKALEDFLEGRYHASKAFEAAVHKSGTRKEIEEEFAKGISYLERAAQEDPNYVPAYLELVKTILGADGRQPHVDLRDKARVALNKALALDETDLTAHLLMAEYLFPSQGYDEPENHYKRVIQLNPNFAQGHEAYAEYLDDLGRFEEGMKEHQKAQEMDPDNDHISPSPLTPRAVRLERKRKFMLTSSPSPYDFWTRGEMEYESRQYTEALKDWEAAARDYGWNEEADAWVRAYAKGGPQALIREVASVLDGIAKEKWFLRDMIINAHRYAGDRTGTLAWLETAEKEWDLSVLRHLRSNYRWDPYRSDPRFQAVARRVGLGQ